MVPAIPVVKLLTYLRIGLTPLVRLLRHRFDTA
jgi:hypothetical protein